MQASAKAIELIKSAEGFVPIPYYCPANVLTIGFGHTINTKSEHYSKVSLQQAHTILIKDIKIIEDVINKSVKVEITQGQSDALCSLIYNWGINNFLKS
ncbi:MAG: lysozyme [Janthinobacterium lividum]